MKITIIGTGYVGLVSGACFADAGNEVICLDSDESKIAFLEDGGMPIHEPGLKDIVRLNRAVGRLRFSTNYDEAIGHAEVIFIAVGTPMGEDGSADLSHVLCAARAIGQRMTRLAVVANKSTVPVGTADKVRALIAHELRRRNVHVPFHVVSNPEFLKEGDAVNDFMCPDRIIIGRSDAEATRILRQLYRPFSRNHEKVIEMDPRSAELTKYVANALLATRISFMNEVANLAEILGADIEAVRHGLGADHRISPHFLYAGIGYGGSCLPKDVKALLNTAEEHGKSLHILQAVEKVNESQKIILFDKMCRHFGGAEKLRGMTVALWGVSFKPNTDDMREAPSLVLIRQLLSVGCRIRIYDPAAGENARRNLLAEYGERICSEFVQYANDPWEAVEGADALALLTEWQEFHTPDLERLAHTLMHAVVFDGRDLYDPEEVINAGMTYYGIGRGCVPGGLAH